MAAPLDLLLARGAAGFNEARRRGQVPGDHTGATLTRLFFANADLSGLLLVGSEWEDCTVGGVDFTGADLTNAWVHGGRFERCSFRGAALAGATFEDVDFVDCDFTGATGLDSLEREAARFEATKGLGEGPAARDPAAPTFTPGHVAVDPALEAQLEARPDDDALWLVYGDWLLSQGDVRGELVARHRAAASREGRAAFDAFVADNLDELFRDCADSVRAGGQAPELTVTWRHGFVHAATLRADNPERPWPCPSPASCVASPMACATGRRRTEGPRTATRR